MWQAVGAAVTVTAVDFPLFQERLGTGQFDSYIGAWLDEPSPRGLADQWTRAGWAALNYGHYANPAFDALFTRAASTTWPGPGALYRQAMDTLNADAPAHLSLRAGERGGGVAAMEGVEIDPYSWMSGLRTWRCISCSLQCYSCSPPTPPRTTPSRLAPPSAAGGGET